MRWLLDTTVGLLKFVVYTLCGVVAPVFKRFRASAPPDLSADVCLITGGGRGLGRELALKFAKCGATIVLWDIDQDGLKSVADEISEGGGDAHYYVCDCSRYEEVQRTAKRVREDVGDVAILINNAGIVTGKSVLGSSPEDVQKVMDVNALAHFWTTKTFLPWMMENNYGYVISIASVLAFGSLPGVADYSASKAAVVNFTEALRHEMIASKKNGISVSCICPYHMDTGMFEGITTRFPWLLGPLKPSLVAERTVKALADRDTLVIIPGYFSGLVLLKWILPVRAYDQLLNISGATDAMKTFVGHRKNQ